MAMNKDKQIEEMRNDLGEAEKEFAKFCRGRHCEECEYYFAKTDCKNQILAEKIVDKGYRKATVVAKEIFKDIDYMLLMMFEDYASLGHQEYSAVIEVIHHKLRVLEKKYTENNYGN